MNVHSDDTLDLPPALVTTGLRHSVFGTWAPPAEKAILSLVTVRTA
jgi:hypothetical protein